VTCTSCGDTGTISKDYSMFACPYCEEGKRTIVTFNPLSMTATIRKVEIVDEEASP
jgi:hypothetical protein